MSITKKITLVVIIAENNVEKLRKLYYSHWRLRKVWIRVEKSQIWGRFFCESIFYRQIKSQTKFTKIYLKK